MAIKKGFPPYICRRIHCCFLKSIIHHVFFGGYLLKCLARFAGFIWWILNWGVFLRVSVLFGYSSLVTDSIFWISLTILLICSDRICPKRILIPKMGRILRIWSQLTHTHPSTLALVFATNPTFVFCALNFAALQLLVVTPKQSDVWMVLHFFRFLPLLILIAHPFILRGLDHLQVDRAAILEDLAQAEPR